jgi:hypothetical protein
VVTDVTLGVVVGAFEVLVNPEDGKVVVREVAAEDIMVH